MEQPEPQTDPQGAVVLLGTIWDDDGCQVRRRAPGRASELVPAIGLELNYRLGADPTRHCLGHHSPKRNQGAYVDCRNPPQPGEKTCVSCAVADAEFAADLHHAHTRHRDLIDRAVVDHLEQRNILYLAAFRDGSVKVGTSTATRTAKRLAEQGAWQAVEVAAVGDGFAVRRLEDLVTEKLGLPQSVAVSRKLRGMASPLDEAALGDRLRPLVADVHGLLRSLDRLPGGDDATGAGDAPDVELCAEHWRFPAADDDVWVGLHQYPARLDRGAHHIEVVAMCGRMAVLGRPGSADRFVADLGRLFGVELDLGRYEPDQLAVQDSLF